MCDVTVSDAIIVSPWQALNAVSTDTDSSSVDLGGVTDEYTMHVIVTGSPTNGSATLQGSLDGVNWYSLLSGNLTNSNTAYSSNSDNIQDSSVVNRRRPLTRYVRARVTSLSGGTSPTVTVNVAVGKVR